ncbi:hypothetical protein [Coralloluteibacterium thermophilus]|uniref:Uncharacterized protein n=1 Tax=Coralloluteibacterium thermophilum TaxID=2707049 RepID=A0ABV9NMK5_9GAMM
MHRPLLPAPHVPASPAQAPDPRLARTLVQWLALGLACVLMLPAARGSAEAIGWLPFWLVVAPASSLALLFRHRLAAACGALLVARPRRRRGDQARPLRIRRQAHGPLRRMLAALAVR